MIRDFYSYIQEQDDDDVISYSFLTSHGLLYYVYFDPYEYNDHIGRYPHLLNSGYGFGFHRMSKGKGWINDPKTGETISKIIFDFIEDRGNDVVLLYHCDYSDAKQKGRDKIFNNWYTKSKIKKAIIKKSVKVSQIEENGKETDYFMGYLTTIENPKKEEVEIEFTTFAENLVSGKP